jgi:uncharacterized protein (TIGR02246 family)
MQFKLFLLVVAALFSGCQTIPSPEAAKSELEGATQAWVAAFDACDVDKITALYLPEAVLWGTTSPIILSTPAGIRQYFERGCSANLQLKVTVSQQLVRVFGDTAINSGSYTFAFVAQGRPGSLPARYTFTYRKVAGKWLIADHHSSGVPAAPPPASTPAR